METLNILLVDDDDDDRDFFAESLKELNLSHHLTTAKDCHELFEILSSGKTFDIIFLDINLPIMNGRQCLREIKRQEDYNNIPVVIYSSSNYMEDIDDSYISGAHYYLVKPYAHINFLASLKIIFEINWKNIPPVPARNNFVINFSYN